MTTIQRNGDRTAVSKIHELENLSALLTRIRVDKKVVHCHGVFDPMHIGHIRHFHQAKKHGDILVVTITPDQYVNKGPHRPIFAQALRAEAIAALECVDFVAVNKWPMAIETIQLLRPDVFIKGSEFRGRKDTIGAIALEEAAVQAAGGRLEFTDDITFSSSNLVNRHLQVLPDNARSFIDQLTSKYAAENILTPLERARSLKVLVIGEAIIDEYHSCEVLGKSGKEPILAARYVSSEKFAGGALAVANHVAALCEHPGLLTFLGERDSHEDFVCEKLSTNIKKMFLYMPETPTIVKQRFVEVYPPQKLFEVYIMGSDEGNAEQSAALCGHLRDVLPEYDVVIVADYGHGMFSQESIDLLCQKARFLAVNTQVNASNHGFNTVSKYSRADFICVSEKELRMDARSRQRDLQDIVSEITARLRCNNMVITMGKQGLLCYSKREGFCKAPGLTTNVVDRVGAGDAVFAVATLCVAQDVPIDIVGFIGNAAGAQAVATVGNRKPIERIPLLRHLEHLLK